VKFATIDIVGETLTGVVDLALGKFWPLRDLIDGLADPADLVAALPQLMATPLAPPTSPGLAFSDVILRAPILKPPHNILCVGKNYRAHAEEFSKSGFDAASSAAEAVPEFPIIFSKPATTITGPDTPIPLIDGLDEAVDYEAELAVIIGTGGRFIARAHAMSHVFGYTIINDVTARDLQRRHKQWFLGKGIDGFCPMGPYIVTADALNLADARVICRVNGQTRQAASIRDLIFDIPALIETISRSMTLSPGDIIATGTPEGVGIGFTPPKFLAEGDVVGCEIPGIGSLRNTVRR
jgi:2-keto-4-pentenoate hydratase/2-oxohepta-3-ene-1,7-dioic acid hydratase in catechol pathway